MSIVNVNIQVSDLYYYITSNQENLNIRNLVGATLYDAKYRKRIIIDSGVTIGSNNTAVAALQIPSALGGDLIIDNYGSIQGAGGPAGNTGGDAILAQASCKINNKSGGTIYGGGGGGGTGGTGGTGGGGVYTYTGQAAGPTDPFTGQQTYIPVTITVYTTGGSGGAGGAGGRGRGYDGALASGSAGSAGSAGETNAGTGGNGGTGGTGGDWGASGSNGSTGSTGASGNYTGGSAGSGGSSGGLAGFYINGLSTYVTLINNGTVAGRTN